MVFSLGSYNIFTRCPVRPETGRAYVDYLREHEVDDRVFVGDRLDLALTMAQNVHTTSRTAFIRKPVSPHLFRRMKIRAFLEANSRPSTWPRGHRSALATLPEALEVLRRGPRIVEERGP